MGIAKPNSSSSLSWAIQRRETILFLSLTIFAFLVFWQYRIGRQHLTPDRSIQVYIAQEILRGHPPYVAVVFPKTPLTAIFSALTILVGNILGLSDVVSVRLLFLVIGALGVAFTFLVAKSVAPSLPARLASAITLTGFGLWARSSAAGPELKILMILFGLITLWALAEKRWLLAGLAASLSFLTWQPAGIYLALALAAPLFSSNGERRRGFLQALAGAFIPLLLVTAYLAAENALASAFRQTIWGQILYATQGGEWTLSRGVRQLIRVVNRGLREESWFVIMGAAGWLGFTSKTVLSWRRPLAWRRSPAINAGGINPWPLLLSGYSWLLFSLRDLQGKPDLIPLLPYLALGLGWFLEGGYPS